MADEKVQVPVFDGEIASLKKQVADLQALLERGYKGDIDEKIASLLARIEKLESAPPPANPETSAPSLLDVIDAENKSGEEKSAKIAELENYKKSLNAIIARTQKGGDTSHARELLKQVDAELEGLRAQ